MGAQGRLRLFPGLLLCPARGDARAADPNRQAELFAPAPGSATPGPEFRPSGSSDLYRLEALISEDVSLSYKLLRYVNSALCSHPGRIQSIRHAIRFLGENNLRKWIPLAAIPRAAEDKPA